MEIIRKLQRKYKPNKWLFEAAKKDISLFIRFAEKSLENICKIAGINKKIFSYKLTNIFSTILLYNSIGKRYAKELLEQNISKTNLIYIYIKNKFLKNIKNTSDTLNFQERNIIL